MLLNLLVTSVISFSVTTALAQDKPASVRVGERLFRETRFAQTQGMSCASCHLLGEAGEPRALTDFAARSPIPWRAEDGRRETLRNTPGFADASLPRQAGLLLHFDGEFGTAEELSAAGLTGRNLGWLTAERSQAIAQIARVIREDGSYPKLFDSPELPRALRVDTRRASDEVIFAAASRLIGAYVEQARYSRTSPYDRFLAKNTLPAHPAPGESDRAYGARLLTLIERSSDPQWVTPEDGQFKLHQQEYRFGPEELEGMKIFLRSPPPGFKRQPGTVVRGIGNCVACHAPPSFTDFSFHNTGASQFEYETLHGQESFWSLHVPTFAERLQNPEQLGRYLSAPDLARPELADLGLWNVMGNPNHPAVQDKILATICPQLIATESTLTCEPGVVLDRTLGMFKTPGIRDLGHTAPYLHSGQMPNLDALLRFYFWAAGMARSGKLRNGDPELSRIFLHREDGEPLLLFMESLNEDFE